MRLFSAFSVLYSQGVNRLAASPMDKFMSGIADMMSGPTPKDGGLNDEEVQALQGRGEPQDMNDFRSSLEKMGRWVG